MPSELKEDIKSWTQFNADIDVPAIEEAVEFAKKAHEGQMRASGEPFYTHPVAVAKILAEMKLDNTSIITAILHDTLEDTDVTYDDLKDKFGSTVAELVNGVSKLTKIGIQTVEGKQAENFRKLLVAMSEDIRVLLVKLADRLHNMRTLHNFNKPEKQKRIARETLEIYARLAERIGTHNIKEELEDLAFSYMNPEARESITNRLMFLRKEESGTVDKIISELKALFKENNLHPVITGREKTRYSIWKKMQRKNVSFEQLSDIMAFRIELNDVGECYHALGVVHSKFPTVPGRFKDYISTPKSNGYSSLHTTIIGPMHQRIEVQIRTSDMHTEAELGVAAHWSYKSGHKKSDLKDAKNYRWLRELLDILDQEQRPEDFLEHTKLELFQEHVFVFSPKGDLIELSAGSTPVDFAYAVHSDVGNRCVGAKVNGRIAPLNSKLQNGDQVDIVTAKTQTPSPTWERFVATGKARSHIRRFIRQQQRDEYMTLGKAMLQKIFRQEDYEFTEKAISNILDKYKANTPDDIYVKIGSGLIVAREVFRSIFPGHQSEQLKNTLSAREAMDKVKAAGARALEQSSDGAMPIKGLIPGMAIHKARCCHPIPGDRIVGIVTTGKGVTIHTIDCETLETFADTPERWLDVAWGDGSDTLESNHVGRIEVTIENAQGALGTLSTVIGKSGGNITNLKIINRAMDFWDMLLDVHVNDTKHLHNVIAALRATPEVVTVERAKGR